MVNSILCEFHLNLQKGKRFSLAPAPGHFSLTRVSQPRGSAALLGQGNASVHTALACCVSYEVTDGIRTHSSGEFQGGKREHAPRRGHFWARGQCGVQRVQFGLSSLVCLFLAEEDPQVGRVGAGSTAWPRKGQHVHRFGVGLPRQDGGGSLWWVGGS